MGYHTPQRRLSPNQRGFKTMLGAIAARLPAAHMLRHLGMGDEAIVKLALDAGVPLQSHDHWRRAPFGSKGRGVKANARLAAKRRAVKRARKMGHA
jgi:hypothetical protein